MASEKKNEKLFYIGYSDFTNTLYCYSKKDYSDKQNVSEQFASIVKKVCKLNNTKVIKIGDLVLKVKENDRKEILPPDRQSLLR